MEPPVAVHFPNGTLAYAIYPESEADLVGTLQELGLTQEQPTLVVIGGASKLSAADFARVQQLFTDVLAPLAQKWKAAVIDGGTDAGVMRLMGQARQQIGGDFPLIGVAPIDLASLPTQVEAGSDAAPLEQNHTHFVLVPGSNWGDESQWIAQLATALAGHHPSVTVLINGGEVTWRDALQSVKADREILVIAGSGRTADILAAAVRGNSTDERAAALVASGLVETIDLSAGFATMTALIEKIFATKG